MDPGDRILLACSHPHLDEEHQRIIFEACTGSAVPWQRIVQLSERHRIAPLLFKGLSQCGMRRLGVPAEVEERLALRAGQVRVQKERTARRVASALAWFNARSIDVMLLKGAALDVLVYTEPWLLGPGDADLVLRCEPGSPAFEETRKRAVELYLDWVECDYFSHHDVTMNDALEVDFARIWSAARRIDYRGQPAWVMAPADLLLSLCISSCRKRFFRLKSLCDIAETVRCLPGLDWDEFVDRVLEFRCEGIAYVALWIVQRTVGCELPEEALADLGLSRVRRAALQSLAGMLLHGCSLEALSPGWGTRRGNLLSLLLPYASYGGRQAWRSFRRRYGARSVPLSSRAPRVQEAPIPCLYWHPASALDRGDVARCELASTGLEVSRFGMLCGASAGLGEGGEEPAALAALWRGFELGVNHFDVADLTCRGRGEEILGKFLRGIPRGEVVIGAGVAASFAPAGSPALEGVRRQLDTSLRRLGIEAIDLCYVHLLGFGGQWNGYLEAVVEDLIRLREEGKVRHFGQCLPASGATALPRLELPAELAASVLRVRLPLMPILSPDWNNLLADVRTRGLGLVLAALSEEGADLQGEALRRGLAEGCLVAEAESPSQVEKDLWIAGFSPSSVPPAYACGSGVET